MTDELQTAIQNSSVQVKQEEQYEVTLKKLDRWQKQVNLRTLWLY